MRKPSPAGGQSSRVSVIIPNLDGEAWLEACLASLSAQIRKPLEVILVDNASTDRSLAIVEEKAPETIIIRLDRNTGFAHAVNRGAAVAKGDYLLFLNTDTIVAPACIQILENTLSDAPDDIASVMPLMTMLQKSDFVDDAGDVLSWYGHAQKRGHGEPAAQFHEQTEIFSPCGGAVLYRASVFNRLEGFDEGYFAYLEDVDLGLRCRLAGYQHWLQPAARVQHKGHGSNMPKRRYLILTTRNRMALFIKNLPAGLLLRHFGRLVYGQAHFALSHGNLLALTGGMASFVRDLPSLLRKRRFVARTTVLAKDDIENLLSMERPSPPVRKLISRRIHRFIRQSEPV